MVDKNKQQATGNKQQATSNEPNSMKLYKRWQDENKTTWLERLLLFLVIVLCALYVTHGHDILNKIILDFVVK